MTRRRIVCVGDVLLDVVAHLPGPLAVGSDTPAPVRLLGGGSAANTAAWVVSAGGSATFVGRVGDDALGRAAVDEMTRTGIDLEVSVDPHLPTGMCIVLVAPSGERTMIPSAGANAAAPVMPPLTAGDHLHVSGYALFRPGVRPEVERALAAARAAGVRVSVDAASAAPLREFGPRRFLDIIGPALVFANQDEAAVLTNTADPERAARSLATSCGAAVVKCGPDGAVWSDGDAVLVERPDEVVTPIDSTGAGDALAAGVLVARASGLDVRSALRAGTALAARAVTQLGGRPPA